MQIIYIVPQSHCVVIERFGKFSRIQETGINFRIPLVEKIKHVNSSGSDWGDVANKKGYLIELTEQQLDTPPRQCFTKDNAQITSNASVYWRIIDPRSALYEVDTLPATISDVALNALRANIGSLDLDQVLSERQNLNEQIVAKLSESGKKWGVQFTRVEIQEIQTDEKTSTAMLQQLEAERRRRALTAEAEGKAYAEITLAEAEKKAAILRAEGQATALEITRDAEFSYLERVKSVVSDGQAMDLLLAQKYITGFDTISKTPGDKVFLPNNFQGILSMPIDSSKKN